MPSAGPSFPWDVLKIPVAPGSFSESVAAVESGGSPVTYEAVLVSGYLELSNPPISSEGILSGTVPDDFLGPVEILVTATNLNGQADQLKVTLHSPLIQIAEEGTANSDGQIEPLTWGWNEFPGASYEAPDPDSFPLDTQVQLLVFQKEASGKLYLGLKQEVAPLLPGVVTLSIPGLNPAVTPLTLAILPFGESHGVQVASQPATGGKYSWLLPVGEVGTPTSTGAQVWLLALSDGDVDSTGTPFPAPSFGSVHQGMRLIQLKGSSAQAGSLWITKDSEVTNKKITPSEAGTIEPYGPACIIVPGYNPTLSSIIVGGCAVVPFWGKSDDSWLANGLEEMDPLVQWAFNNTYYKSVFVLEYDTHASIDNQEERIIFPGCYPPDVFGSAQQLHLLFSLEGGFWSRYAEVNGLPQKTVRPDVDFMCHSEGGIVTRRYLQEWAPKSAASHYPDVKRVRAFVSMASPQAGIPLGSVGTIGCDQGAQDMEEGSCQIASLNGGTALKAGDEGSGVILVDDFASTRVFTIGAYNDIVVGLKGMSASPRFLSNKHPNRRLIVDIPGGLCLTSPWCDHETIHTSFTLGCVRWAMGEAIDYGGNHNWSNSPPTSTKDFVDRWLFPFTSVSQASGDPWIEGEPASIEIDHTGHSHPPQGMLVEISLDDGLTWDSLKTMPPKIVSGSVPGQGQAGIVRVDIPALPMVPSGSGTSAIARLRVWDGMFYAKESPDLTIARLTIQSVSPPEAQSGESLVLTASGTGFSSDSQMRLQGSKTILGTGEQASPQGTSISAQFDLAGALEGFYSVVVTNPSGKETTLQGGFQITLETGDPTAQWTAPPPASVQVGQSFQVAWTTSGNPDHVNIHWHPTDPLGPGNGFGPPDTTNSSTFSPTPSPYTLVTPTKNIDGSPITLPTTVKYVVHVKNSSTGAEGSSAIVSVILTPSPLTAQWTVPPPASVQVGQSFQVAWTTAGSPDHVNIHWHPTDPLGPGNGFGPPDTTNSSTLSPTHSPYMLVAPTKNIDGSPITVPTTVKYVVHVKNTSTGAEGSSAIVSVILTPSPLTAQWTVPPPASAQVGQSFQVAWTTSGSPDHVNIHWHPTDPLGPGNGFGPPDTTNSSTLSPTPSPYTLVAPTKNIDGSPITVPTTVKYVVHVKNTSTGAEGSSAIVSVILTPSPLTAQWTVPPPASAQVGQSFQVAWTTSGNPDHVNIHWHPTDPLGPGNGFGPPDTTNSSTLSPTPSPYTLVAPTKNIDGSPITVPTMVKYVVHVKKSSPGAEGNSAIVSVTVNP